MERLNRIEKAIEALQQSQLKTDAQLVKTDLQLAKTDKQLAKTNAQLEKSEKSWQETKKILSNVGINLGHVAEEFFYFALKEEKRFGNIQFDEISLNVKGRNRKTQDEFDIVLYNGDSIGLIEIKHKVHPNDLEQLKTRKVENFKLLFPDYADCRFYLGIGGMSIPAEVEAQALACGMAVLRQKGEAMELSENPLKAY
jgi:hypothetical protein